MKGPYRKRNDFLRLTKTLLLLLVIVVHDSHCQVLPLGHLHTKGAMMGMLHLGRLCGYLYFPPSFVSLRRN